MRISPHTHLVREYVNLAMYLPTYLPTLPYLLTSKHPASALLTASSSSCCLCDWMNLLWGARDTKIFMRCYMFVQLSSLKRKKKKLVIVLGWWLSLDNPYLSILIDEIYGMWLSFGVGGEFCMCDASGVCKGLFR